MAKIKSSLMELSGKLGDEVFVSGPRTKNHVRKRPAAGSKRNEPALKKQYTSTGYINQLASEINTIIKSRSGSFKSRDFYQSLLKPLLKKVTKDRLLLLLRLKGIEINARYPFSILGTCTTTVRELKNKITVNLDILSHPAAGKYKANSYYYEVLLLTWAKNKNAATHSCQLSDWMRIDAGLPEFEFLFPKPAGTKHWLLCLGQRRGINETETELFTERGMQIVDVGTFDKKEQTLLKKMNADNAGKRDMTANKPPVKEEVRVKAKRMK